ncbi:peptidylprolyl isomerase [Eubacterium sp. MSJ-33]|uniref:peptidylprolyl isomerase n=1 Tax=Eubacterium sp. MSJ-33 TaxID=2841528 RepID=UPI001C792383|nr:peptidylprolyl isomerase [Eubacterium sp. MSJ-33]QWT52683.1 peptidylprolyl isomerase [Eubacterium sp. MSJ-33]
MKHNRRYRKLIAILLCICLMVPMLSGCGEKKEEPEQTSNGTLVFQYGNNLVTKGEIYIYIETVRERYELQYGSDVWQTVLPDGGEGASMENLTREEVVNEIVRVKTLCAHADELGIVLSDEELSELNRKADDFCEGLTDEQLQSMEITKEKAEKVMQENAIASKVEAKILDDRKIEISDEEARMTTFYDMYFECYSMDENGVVTPYTEEQKDQQYRNALQACATLAATDLRDFAGAAIGRLAEYYQLNEAKMQTMSPSQILETYGQDVYDLLYSMENGQYSTVVETQYGYHVFQMIALTDQTKTNEQKIVIYNQQVQEALSDTLTKWQAQIDPVFKYPDSVDMDVYDSIVNETIEK